MVFVFVVRRVELYDGADSICCTCAFRGKLSLGLLEGSWKKTFFRNESLLLFQR